jgi:hypothetical protein
MTWQNNEKHVMYKMMKLKEHLFCNSSVYLLALFNLNILNSLLWIGGWVFGLMEVK